jgi:YihY family inner membrane protein
MRPDLSDLISATISGMAQARAKAGAAALLILIWAACQGFNTMVLAANRAWGDAASDWWRLPLKSLALLAIMTALAPAGLAASAMIRIASRALPGPDGRFLSALLAIGLQFLGLAFFYAFAPRRRTRLSEVWSAALAAALLLRAAEASFALYLSYFAAANAIYGVFGSIMALLLWIYLSGCVFIYGACLCAARAESPPFAVPPQ